MRVHMGLLVILDGCLQEGGRLLVPVLLKEDFRIPKEGHAVARVELQHFQQVCPSPRQIPHKAQEKGAPQQHIRHECLYLLRLAHGILLQVHHVLGNISLIGNLPAAAAAFLHRDALVAAALAPGRSGVVCAVDLLDGGACARFAPASLVAILTVTGRGALAILIALALGLVLALLQRGQGILDGTRVLPMRLPEVPKASNGVS
mmetsp:Transcript_20727/g.44208  ORF Transcript_20727/g.44208 Transcript_20727/m.44208 type:complete len:204 (+) Transcript_20727:2694-3305(+)